MESSVKIYLRAVGAVEVSALSGVAVEPQWLARRDEHKVIRTAQQLAGDRPDAQQALAALQAAAAFHRVQLTPGQVVTERATRASLQLDNYLQGGLMRAFNAEYARRRKAGLTNLPFMKARARFKRLLVRRLVEGRSSHGLIDEVFN